MIGDSWTHKIARICVRPLVNTPVSPNHLTVLRLLTGVAACFAFAIGDKYWDFWGGWLWLLSAFLDRADGELARYTGKITLAGHKFDMLADTTVTSLFFLSIGIGTRDTELGNLTIIAGAMGSIGVLAAENLAETLDQMKEGIGEKAYGGHWGFDFDDILYLFAPIVWLGWQLPFVLGASIGAPIFAVYTWNKLRCFKNIKEKL